ALASKPGGGGPLIALWSKHEALLAGVPEADGVRKEVAAWTKRIEASDRFLATVQQPRTERSIVEAWDRLQSLGGHPDADGQRARVDLARRRADLLDKLRGMSATVTEESDRLFRQAWDEPTLAGCDEADPLRPRLGESE